MQQRTWVGSARGKGPVWSIPPRLAGRAGAAFPPSACMGEGRGHRGSACGRKQGGPVARRIHHPASTRQWDSPSKSPAILLSAKAQLSCSPQKPSNLAAVHIPSVVHVAHGDLAVPLSGARHHAQQQAHPSSCRGRTTSASP